MASFHPRLIFWLNPAPKKLRTFTKRAFRRDQNEASAIRFAMQDPCRERHELLVENLGYIEWFYDV